MSWGKVLDHPALHQFLGNFSPGEVACTTLEVSTCARIFDEAIDGVWASDHFGVVADLAVPTRSSALLP